MTDIRAALAGIVGEDYVSDCAEERYLYARDPGTQPPRAPDLVVLPGSVEEVREVVALAHRERVPIVPLGAGLVLSGLSLAHRGGIVLDMKRMDRVLEVDERARYALVEAGCPQGKLRAYLEQHHPTLKHSIPDAPPMATLAGNVLIHGSGHLSAMAGFHTEMLNGLEAVLPTGEVVKLGSCSASPFWFSRAPLPDLAGLFLGWNGTTGVVTRLAIKLFPRRRLQDVAFFVTEDPELVPDVLHRISGTGVCEDIVAWVSSQPPWALGFQHVAACYAGDSRDELRWRRNLVHASVQRYRDEKVGGFVPLPPKMRQTFLEAPGRSLTRFADVRQGGGFEYVGAIMPVALFARAYEVGVAIAREHGIDYTNGARIIGQGHAMMFYYAYPFDRSDEADLQVAREALEQTNLAALRLGGIPWKAEAPAQRAILAQMDPETAALMDRVRGLLDPHGIMNPGNWERS